MLVSSVLPNMLISLDSPGLKFSHNFCLVLGVDVNSGLSLMIRLIFRVREIIWKIQWATVIVILTLLLATVTVILTLILATVTVILTLILATITVILTLTLATVTVILTLILATVTVILTLILAGQPHW